MTERAASSTAVLVCQGRAVADGRYAVGTFSDPVAWHLLDPDEREQVEAARTGTPPPDGRRTDGLRLLWRTGILMVPRTVAIDAAVREHGATQVVVVGAGLDARAWRMPGGSPGATVVEVDHPASQRDKQRRLGDLTPTARAVVPVPVNLSREALAPALEQAGFDPAVETTWVWEGVVPYLTPEAVRATVGQVGRFLRARQPARRQLPVEVAHGHRDASPHACRPAPHASGGPARRGAVALDLDASVDANHAVRQRLRRHLG